MQNKPNLFIVGAQKSGTTRLSYLLDQHRDVFFSSPKEPEFFNQANPSQEWTERYKNLFSQAAGHKFIGEGSSVYSRNDRFPGTAQRIHELDPSARIIYMVRHPLDRLESAWVQIRSEERSMSPDFCKAVRTSADLLDTTLYWKQLSDYRRFFADDQIMLIFFEDFIRNEQEVVTRCCQFLGIEDNQEINFDERGKNSFQGKRQAKPVLDFLRSLPLYDFLRRVLPKSPREVLKRGMMKPVNTKPEWDEATLRWAIQQVESDTRQILCHGGKASDFWKLSMDRATKK